MAAAEELLDQCEAALQRAQAEVGECRRQARAVTEMALGALEMDLAPRCPPQDNAVRRVTVPSTDAVSDFVAGASPALEVHVQLRHGARALVLVRDEPVRARVDAFCAANGLPARVADHLHEFVLEFVNNDTRGVGPS